MDFPKMSGQLVSWLFPSVSKPKQKHFFFVKMERREKLPGEMKEDEEKKKQQAEEDARKEEAQVKNVFRDFDRVIS